MFSNLISWLKSHKLISVLILVIVFLLWKQYHPLAVNNLIAQRGLGKSATEAGIAFDSSPLNSPKSSSPSLPSNSSIPPSDSPDRIVIQETTLSLVVKDVAVSLSQIQSKTESLGGFLVNSRLSKPQEGGNGTIIVRVPEERLAEALSAFRATGLRVVDEQVSGRDVTDQYEDISAKLTTLEKTKTKFEEIMGQANKIQDILQVQREIISLQQQIDSLKGRQQYLQKSADLSKITVYLSTDEFSLPYAPKEVWRPEVVFKQAVRALVTNIRKIATSIIWVVVFSPLWLPILLAAWFLNRRKKYPRIVSIPLFLLVVLILRKHLISPS